MAMFTHKWGLLTEWCLQSKRVLHNVARPCSKEQRRSLRLSHKASCEWVPPATVRWEPRIINSCTVPENKTRTSSNALRASRGGSTIHVHTKHWQALAVHIYISHVLHISINAHLVWICLQANRIESEWYCVKVRAASPPFEVGSRHA